MARPDRHKPFLRKSSPDSRQRGSPGSSPSSRFGHAFSILARARRSPLGSTARPPGIASLQTMASALVGLRCCRAARLWRGLMRRYLTLPRKWRKIPNAHSRLALGPSEGGQDRPAALEERTADGVSNAYSIFFVDRTAVLPSHFELFFLPYPKSGSARCWLALSRSFGQRPRNSLRWRRSTLSQRIMIEAHFQPSAG
jgi:hypothetical protein